MVETPGTGGRLGSPEKVMPGTRGMGMAAKCTPPSAVRTIAWQGGELHDVVPSNHHR